MARNGSTYEEGHGLLHRMGEFVSGLTSGHPAAFRALGPPIPKLLSGDPEFARALYRGSFAFAGATLVCQPDQVFTASPPSPQWFEELHGFSWLAHLEATGLALYRAFARGLVQQWSLQRRRTSFETSCRRLLSLARYGAFLLRGAGSDFEQRFLHDVAAEARRLAGQKPKGEFLQMRQAIALVAAGLAFRGVPHRRDEWLERASHLAKTVVLPDGGAMDRSPASLLSLLADLVPLREALVGQRIAIPRELNAAVERAMPMLRMLCHGDDGLAVFHGVESTSVAAVRALLERDMVLGRPLAHAAHSGYCRLNHGQSAVIVDCGPPSICDSGLAFEFSDGPQRLVGSCGFPPNASPAWREAARQLAAHSTLEVDEGNTQSIRSFFQRKTKRPRGSAVTAEVVQSPHGALIKARGLSHVATLGLEHRRELFLAAGGHDFRGEDSFVIADPRERQWPDSSFAIRFHLHPAVKATLDRKSAAVTLLLPDGHVWQFTARGGGLNLEDSISFATGGGPRPCRQIVIRGTTGRPERVNWAFRKLNRGVQQQAAPASSPL